MAAAPLQITRHGETISVSRFLVARPPPSPTRWTPFFALIVEIICVRKSRKTRYFCSSSIRSDSLLSLSLSLSLSLPSVPPYPFYPAVGCRSEPPCERKYTRNDTSFSRGFLLVLLLIVYWHKYHRAPDIKVTVMTLAKNVDDTQIRIPSTDPRRSSALS